MIAKQVFYEGRVQGVGFRYSTKQLAMGFDVTGWVRNLSDEELEDFLQEVRESHLGPHIKHEEVHAVDLLEDVSGFSIRH